MSTVTVRSRRGQGHARRPKQPLRHRLRLRLPSRGRLFGVTGLAAALAAVVVALHGPWLRVGQVTYTGNVFTSPAEVDPLLDSLRDAPLLALDSRAISARLEELPAVAAAEVHPILPDRLEVTLTEKSAAAVWRTTTMRLLVAADGRVFAELPRFGPLGAGAAGLPVVDDRRASSTELFRGDSLGPEEVAQALRLVDLDPRLLGSHARRFTVRVDDLYGLVLISDAGWKAAMGVPLPEPGSTAPNLDAILDDQVAAIRTLFTTRPERTVGWLDVRNPGKVYWAP
jgi:cell division septal protein FtsQ